MTGLPQILGSLTGEEALHVYNALAQWADNERNGLEEMDEPDPKHVAAVQAVEAVVERLESEIVKAAR